MKVFPRERQSLPQKRSKQNYLAVNEVLTDMVGQVSEFDEIAKTTYIEPVRETEEPEEKEITVTEPEVREKDYDLSFAEEEEIAVPAEKLFFCINRNICYNQHVRNDDKPADYAVKKNIIIPLRRRKAKKGIRSFLLCRNRKRCQKQKNSFLSGLNSLLSPVRLCQ